MLKCAACGDPARWHGPQGLPACRDCLRLLKLKRVQWLSPAFGWDPGGGEETCAAEMWDSARSGKEVFLDASAEAKRLGLWRKG